MFIINLLPRKEKLMNKTKNNDKRGSKKAKKNN